MSIAEKWELDLRGDNICFACGSSSPCGNILDCAWWSDDKKQDKEIQKYEDRRMQEYYEQLDRKAVKNETDKS